jgi:hypothetical protein
MKAVELELDQEDWFAIWTESIGNDSQPAKRSDTTESKTKNMKQP